MDAVHLHLALNHVPVLGTVFAAIALGVSGWRRNPEFVRLSLWGVVLLCVVSVAIKFTGDFAWDELRPWPQPYDGARVQSHEQAADRATTAVFFTGLAAGAALWVGRKRPTVPGGLTAAVLVLLLGTFGLMAWTANSGGQLRHPQLRENDFLNCRAAAPDAPSAVVWGQRAAGFPQFALRRRLNWPPGVPSYLCASHESRHPNRHQRIGP